MEKYIHWTEKGYLDSSLEAECKFLSTFDDTFPFYHDHDYFELFLVHDGSVIHCVNDKRMLLSKGALVFIRPKDVHVYERDDANECQIINLAFRDADMQALLHFLGPGFDADRLMQPDLPPTLVLSGVENDDLLDRFRMLNTIPVSRKQVFHTQLRILLLDIFSKYFSQQHEPVVNMPDWFAQLIDEMKKPQNFVLGTEALERLAHKSAGHLCRIFKKYLNQTPTQFINEQRLNYAANLLIRSDKKIITIAFDAGYTNLSHFNHLFKKHFNMSPKNFRQNYRNKKFIIRSD